LTNFSESKISLLVASMRRVTSRMLPLYLAGMALCFFLHLVLPPFSLLLLSYALVFSIACLGLNLLLGNTGLLSFGHAAYFGVGAYTGGFLYAFTPVSSFEVYLISGVLVSAAVSAVFGFVCVRTTRIHFTILTLALAQTVRTPSEDTDGIRVPFSGRGAGASRRPGGPEREESRLLSVLRVRPAHPAGPGTPQTREPAWTGPPSV